MAQIARAESTVTMSGYGGETSVEKPLAQRRKLILSFRPRRRVQHKYSRQVDARIVCNTPAKIDGLSEAAQTTARLCGWVHAEGDQE